LPTTRRGFLGAVIGSAPFLSLPFVASAQTAATPAPSAPSVPSAAPDATPTPAPPDPRAQALAHLARERYGRFLSPEELTMLDERIAGLERRSARLRSVKLANGDEPAAVFRARRP
jgi:hypothetical protein